MSYVPIEKVVDKADGSIYKLVILAAARALEISEGLPPLTDIADKHSKSTTIALQEIAEGKIRFCKS
jgi:DNA-directed RNA polymerase omega subunit